MKKTIYEAPLLEVVYVRIEKGFANSVPIQNDYAGDGEAGQLQEGSTYNF